jgi:hypothetical protein
MPVQAVMVPGIATSTLSVLHLAAVLLCACRFLRIRPDKSVEDASGPDLIQQLYNKQSRRIHQD